MRRLVRGRSEEEGVELVRTLLAFIAGHADYQSGMGSRREACGVVMVVIGMCSRDAQCRPCTSVVTVWISMLFFSLCRLRIVGK